MIFVISFLVFLFFVLALSLSLVIKRRPLVGEDEARTALMDDGNCATCGQMCALAGRKTNKKLKDCSLKIQLFHIKMFKNQSLKTLF